MLNNTATAEPLARWALPHERRLVARTPYFGGGVERPGSATPSIRSSDVAGKLATGALKVVPGSSLFASGTMVDVLHVRSLTKSYGGRVVLTDVSLDVAAGEIVALLGPNGVGKTTLLRCLVGLEVADEGEVRLESRAFDTRDASVRAAVCTLLDDLAWFPDLTVAEHLDLLARADGVASPSGVVADALAALRLTDLADQVPGTLSSGQKQRLSLGTAMVRPWQLLIADEPEQRLDHEGRHWLGTWLAGQAADGRAVLMACHDAELVEKSGARAVKLPES